MAGVRVRNGRELRRALEQLGQELDEQLDDVLGILMLDGFRECVRRTPVRTGFLRSMWRASRGNFEITSIKNPGGSFGQPDEPKIKPEWGDRIFIYNNTEYASYVNNGVNQRAQPMIEPAYFYITAKAEAILKRLSRDRVS